MNQIKTKDIAQVRSDLLIQQCGLCGLCGEAIEPGRAVLDHDHVSGHIRGVLHRGCNALEGQIVNALPRNLITPERLAEIFRRWAQYHQDLKPMLHPRHRSPGSKPKKRRKKSL
jgi:hypothetical protein